MLTCEDDEQRAALMEAVVRNIVDGAISRDSRLLLSVGSLLLPV